MAVDEALMESARAGVVTLRFYRWRPGTLSFGRNQAARGRYDAAEARSRGIGIVRRPTGGRAVYHHRELTYSVTAPTDAWGSLRDAYCRINRALADGLRKLGADVRCAAAGSRNTAPPRPSARACFRDPLPGEVVAGGRKLVGSAQWRDRGALLQHGSLLLVNDQQVTEDLLITPPPTRDAHAGAIALCEVLDAAPPLADLEACIARSFEQEFALRLEPGTLTPAEKRRAARLEARFADTGWTWRR